MCSVASHSAELYPIATHHPIRPKKIQQFCHNLAWVKSTKKSPLFCEMETMGKGNFWSIYQGTPASFPQKKTLFLNSAHRADSKKNAPFFNFLGKNLENADFLVHMFPSKFQNTNDLATIRPDLAKIGG